MPLYNIGKKNNGRSFDFFQKINVSNTDFDDNPDMIITFHTHGILMLNEGTGAVEYSFNGNHVHGELVSGTASSNLSFYKRVVSTIWFRVKSGSSGPITIRVDAWA